MLYLLLTLHLVGALITAALVTQQRARASDPVGKLVLGLVTFGVALLAWPLMLGVAIHRYVKGHERFR